ncbi:MAG: hypothetical protein AAF901_04165 [Bacteroidota bacterium]
MDSLFMGAGTMMKVYPTDLDESGGHYGPTLHNPDGEYHYHIQNELYLNTYYIIFPGDYQGTSTAIM